jgi:hypothetical protein
MKGLDKLTNTLSVESNDPFKLSRGEICVANFIPPCKWCESPRAISARFGTKRLFLEQKAMK